MKGTVLLAGGGTGGHIFPNLAVLERLREAGFEGRARLLVSCRPLDAQIAGGAGVEHVAVEASPWSPRPVRGLRFLRDLVRGRRRVRRLIEEIQTREQGPVVMVATGGFVSAPCVAAARAAGGSGGSGGKGGGGVGESGCGAGSGESASGTGSPTGERGERGARRAWGPRDGGAVHGV